MEIVVQILEIANKNSSDVGLMRSVSELYRQR